MKTNFKVSKGHDYAGNKCWRVSYEEYDTLYTIPTPFYTKKMAREVMREERKRVEQEEKLKKINKEIREKR